MSVHMAAKTIAGTATIIGALGAAALGLGAGMAQANPGPSIPPGPHFVDNLGHWHPLPPGQIQQVCPWHAPPGHWVGGPHGLPCS